MKLLIICIISIRGLISCEKNVEKIIPGTWNEVEHKIDGAPVSTKGSITFNKDGTYTSDFSYPWQCLACDNTADEGTWSYLPDNERITLNSTKNQTIDCLGQQISYPSATRNMSVRAFDKKELKVSYLNVTCGEWVEITFHK
jgi:hypothetical protein